jgi:hypothetical protein
MRAAADAAADDAASLAGGVDHGVFAAHACVTWAANAAWVACIWAKLEGRLGAGVRWSAVFAPTWAAHAVQLGVHAAALRNTVRSRAVWCAAAASADALTRTHTLSLCRARAQSAAVRRQLGPPLPHDAPLLAVSHRAASAFRLRRCHAVCHACFAVDSLTALAVKATFAAQLQRRDDVAAYASASESSISAAQPWLSFRLLLTPLWVGWALSMALACAAAPHERAAGYSGARVAARDGGCALFFLLAAKLDGGLGRHGWVALCAAAWVLAAVAAAAAAARAAGALLWRQCRPAPAAAAELSPPPPLVVQGCVRLRHHLLRLSSALLTSLCVHPPQRGLAARRRAARRRRRCATRAVVLPLGGTPGRRRARHHRRHLRAQRGGMGAHVRRRGAAAPGHAAEPRVAAPMPLQR